MRLKAANGELTRAALHDPLTDMANRVDFDAALAGSAERVQGRGARLAVLFVDLDGFEPVDDVLGHQVGEEVLRCVARRPRGTWTAAPTSSACSARSVVRSTMAPAGAYRWR
jgi:GGDEF domain-containing protein